MIFNHEHAPVWAYEDGPSFCPECNGPLIAKRPEHAIWHWAHKPVTKGRTACPWEESEWHLRWKMAQMTVPGWEVEKRIVVGGKTYILDAYHAATGRVREFVHSLSPYYVDKHLALKAHGLKTTWIFDGEMFISARALAVKGGKGIRRALKPSANYLHMDIGGYLHWGGALFKEWKSDVWFPCELPGVNHLLTKFEQAKVVRFQDLKDLA